MMRMKPLVLTVLSAVLYAQNTVGNNFPPVSNPPPIPGDGIRTVDIQQPRYFIQEDINQEPPQPNIRDDLFPFEIKPDDQRWYFQENESSETGGAARSTDTFDRYYSNGEPAVGPVATPLPDDTYVAQPSSISNVNPNDATNIGSSDIIILTQGSDKQLIPERWVRLEAPSDRLVDIINQAIGSPIAADTVKSITAPVLPQATVQKQITPSGTADIVQQVWIRAPNVVDTQKVVPTSGTVFQDVPLVKQVVDIPTIDGKQVVQQQITKDYLPIPPPTSLVTQKSFSVPPPPPPPLKGGDVVSKSVSPFPTSVIPDPTVVVSSKTEVVQPVRHIWIPTSSTTGKFISVPAPSVVDSGKSISDKAPPAQVMVSDTWVLKQDGSIPTFESQKSVPPPPPIPKGKVIIQNGPVIPVGSTVNVPVVPQVYSPKNPVVDKSASSVNIWPARKTIVNPQFVDKTPLGPQLLGVIRGDKPQVSVITSKFGAAGDKSLVAPPVVGKSLIAPPVQKIIGNTKLPVLPPQLPPTVTTVVNGKPCPIPPQKALFSPRSTVLVAPPTVIATQPQRPLSRIIRVNRYPSGTYYLLNNRIRSLPYPITSALIQSSRPSLVRVIQSKQMPIPIKTQQPIIPFQRKQISIPVQSKTLTPVTNRQIAFAMPSRQIIVPFSSLKSQSNIFYPASQATRSVYPWSTYLSSIVPGNSVLGPSGLSPLKLSSLRSNPDPNSSGSSSESSSESSSSETKENSSKEESSASNENEKEAEKDSKEEIKEKNEKPEKDSEESSSESEVKESIETAESQVTFRSAEKAENANLNDDLKIINPYSLRFDYTDRTDVQNPEEFFKVSKYFEHNEDLQVNSKDKVPDPVDQESVYLNFISNKIADVEGTAKSETETEAGTSSEPKD